MTTSTFDPAADARRPARTTARRPPTVTAPPARRDNRRPGPPGPGSPGPRPHRPGHHTSADTARQAQPHWWFADRLVEVLSGRRPAAWMLGHTSGEAAYERLWQLASQGALRPPKGHPAPRVHGCGYRAPAPGVREAFARVRFGDTLRALAFRLELGTDRRWRCTALECAAPAW
ncbi:Rv3235 family protein [Streptomyces sp. RPT161]|uniref:Rv3235 family protein n=1 Tax=Streptomyces sp. RPT161 TaxID=3015993 RepID=UPI0022B8A9B6|nr:Rv3235 family protein [Streptomyces sp. RPT161]